MSALDFALSSVNATDCSPFLAALDEEAYCEAILPLLGDVEQPSWPGADYCECGTMLGEWGECTAEVCEA